MASARSMSSYKSSNQNIFQKKKRTLKARSNNIWKCSIVNSIAYRCNHCRNIRAIARRIERTRLAKIAYFNEDFEIPTLREMIHMTRISIVQNKRRQK
jgi:hypothetical protein